MRKVLTIVSVAVLASACGSKSDTGTTTTTTTTTTKTTGNGSNTTTTTAPAKNAALDVMKAWGEATEKNDWDKVKSMYAADAVVIPVGSPMKLKGPEAIAKFFKMFRGAFPDLKSWPTHALAKGDTVASIAMMKGTHKGAMGPGMPATNKQMSFMGFEIATVKDGKIVKQLLFADNYNFMAQLGMVKEPNFRKVWEGAEPTLITAVSSDSDVEKKNIAAIDELLKQVNARDAMKAVVLYAGDAWLDDQAAPARVGGNGNILKEYQSLFKMFPDVALKDATSWAAGDYVVTTYTFTGKNTGASPGAPATNKAINLQAASVFHLKDGKIKNHTIFWDGMAFRMQLGILNIPGM